MTTHDQHHPADKLQGHRFPGVPEDDPQKLDESALLGEEAVAASSEESVPAGRLAYAVHATSSSPPGGDRRLSSSRAWMRRL